MISLEIGECCKLTLKLNDNILTYTCVVVNISDDTVTFIDKFGHEWEYKREVIIGKQYVDNTLLKSQLLNYLKNYENGN